MKIAYLISTYLDPMQLKKTIDALLYKDLCDFYIHVDKKVDISPFQIILKDYKNVYFVEDRIHVCWGGYSQVEAILSMISLMLNSNKKYDRVVSMTGLDYPIYSNKKIQDYFNNNHEYMIGMNISDCMFKRQTRKFKKYWFFDHKFNNPLLVKCVSKIWNVVFSILPFRKKNYIVSNNSEKYKIYFSSDYWALTYDCVNDIYQKYVENRSFERYFRHCFAPSELFVSTMLFNSKYGYNAEIMEYDKYTNLSSLTKLHYIHYDGAIKILTESDFETIIKSDKMFARKFRSDVSDKLIMKIDRKRV